MIYRALSLLLVGFIHIIGASSLSADQHAGIDFAQIMPRSTMVYVEISEPADQVERLAEAMGLMGSASVSDEDPVTIELEDGFVLSSDFRVSPSLLAEFKRIRGAAISLAGPLEDKEPLPLVAIDPGESSLLRGLLETGIQVVPRAERIAGYPTYHHEEGDFWCVQTSSLFIASSQRSHLVEAAKRVRGDGASLIDNPRFTERREAAGNCLVFAYADGPTVMKHAGPLMRDEAAVARAVLDLDHLRCATAMVRATDSGAKAEIKITMEEDHNSLGYGMIRTVPFRPEIFAQIPGDAAIITAVGINPPVRFEGEQSSQVTAMDIGREFFANLAEVAMFILPSVDSHNDEVPNFGFVVRANDAEKSESLWTQLLGLPAMLGSDDGPRVEEVTIAGHEGKRYSFDDDDAPQLTVIRVDDSTMVVGTEDAVTAAVDIDRRESILGDDDMARAIRSAPKHASKAVFARVGRLAQLAAQLEHGHDAEELAVVAQVLRHTKVVAVSDEAPHEFTVRVEATELPVFSDVIRMVAGMQERSRAPRGVVAHAE